MYKKLKRVIDLIFASIGLLFLFPVFILISLLSYFSSYPSIFFKQRRIGYQGKEFIIWKFCTMNMQQDEQGRLLPEAKRITPWGHFLRTTSLDELPQLWNIIRGEMSFIGPRPLLVEYFHLYSERHLRRHHQKPGITGWAQIKGRNSVDWEERFEYDVWYVENISFFFFVKIVILTFYTLIFSSNTVNAKEGLSMEKFKGYKK
ncbi:MAG: sugar transferase [Cytophagales bacterium]|nr:sugar transferase [Cytophagales bacterium]